MDTRHKILLVDHDPVLCDAYREILAELPSQPEVHTATSGPRALAMLEAEPFDLLICDLKMPKMDGLQILEIVRRKYPQLRTMVLTVNTDEQFRLRAYAMGVDLFCDKPASEQETKLWLQDVESLLKSEPHTLARADSEEQCQQGEYQYKAWKYAEAVQSFRLAAEGGHARAQCWLGYCYGRGEGVARDMAEAVRWLQQAARQGEMTAAYNLGVCYESGLGVAKDNEQMVTWYQKAANREHLEAQFRLGRYYVAMPHTALFAQLGADVEARLGLSWLGTAAKRGHTKSQLQLGHLHSLPGGQLSEAVKWYRTAAESGSEEGQAALGRCFEDGRGVPQDYAEALKWYRESAENRGKHGPYCLGSCYAEGKGVVADPVEASKWFRQAAERGLEEAMLEIGKRYERGEGVPLNSSEAARWLREAAETLSSEKRHWYFNLEKPILPTEPPAKTTTKPPCKPRCTRPLRIVMLDDEPLVLDSLKLMLGFDLPNSFILTFNNAESALQELEWKEPDLFTTDMHHPGLTCEQMLRRLAARRVKHPVFVISAWELNWMKELFKQLGDQGLNVTLLAKPFMLKDLRELMSVHLGLGDYAHTHPAQTRAAGPCDTTRPD